MIVIPNEIEGLAHERRMAEFFGQRPPRMHARKNILKSGYVFTNYFTDKPTLGQMKNLARELNVGLSGLKCWRIDEDYWEYFVRPNDWSRFIDEPALHPDFYRLPSEKAINADLLAKARP